MSKYTDVIIIISLLLVGAYFADALADYIEKVLIVQFPALFWGDK